MNKKAKLIAIIGVLLISISTDLLAGPVFVHRQNKGLFGYKYILHTPTEQVDRLDCMDPGLKRCRFPKLSNSDYSLNSLNAHLEQVEAAIDNGADSGSMSWGNTTATWNTNASGLTIIEFNLPD
jgi:hypothetical protein